METTRAAATPNSQREPVAWRGPRRAAILVAVALALSLTAACAAEPEAAALLDEALVGRSLASLVRDLPAEGRFELRAVGASRDDEPLSDARRVLADRLGKRLPAGTALRPTPRCSARC